MWGATQAPWPHNRAVFLDSKQGHFPQEVYLCLNTYRIYEVFMGFHLLTHNFICLCKLWHKKLFSNNMKETTRWGGAYAYWGLIMDHLFHIAMAINTWIITKLWFFDCILFIFHDVLWHKLLRNNTTISETFVFMVVFISSKIVKESSWSRIPIGQIGRKDLKVFLLLWYLCSLGFSNYGWTFPFTQPMYSSHPIKKKGHLGPTHFVGLVWVF